MDALFCDVWDLPAMEEIIKERFTSSASVCIKKESENEKEGTLYFCRRKPCIEASKGK